MKTNYLIIWRKNSEFCISGYTLQQIIHIHLLADFLQINPALSIKTLDSQIPYLVYILYMKQSSAPALERGIEIIRLLTERSPLSLEKISTTIKAPKSTVSRLLEVLCQTNIVFRDFRSKNYFLIETLVPAITTISPIQIDNILQNLTEETNLTAEWYIPNKHGLLLLNQKDPVNSEISIRVGIGFIRSWFTEIEAVSAIGLAFYKDISLPSKSKRYLNNGTLSEINKTDIKKIIQTVKKENGLLDSVFNINGIRRMAVPIFGKNKKLIAIVAIVGTSLTKSVLLQEENFNILKNKIGAINENFIS